MTGQTNYRLQATNVWWADKHIPNMLFSNKWYTVHKHFTFYVLQRSNHKAVDTDYTACNVKKCGEIVVVVTSLIAWIMLHEC